MGKLATHAPSSNTAAVITVAAVPGVKHELEMLFWSYDADPTAGGITIECPSGTTVASFSCPTKGPGFLPFSGSCMKMPTANAAMIITLAAGGSGVTGKINCVTRDS